VLGPSNTLAAFRDERKAGQASQIRPLLTSNRGQTMESFLSTTIAAAQLVHQRINRLFGGQCGHDDYTVPMRLPGEKGITVSCLQCAARLRYDWDQMGIASVQ
jgi:hypothetical protein